jgi:DNA replication protein DnaD
MVEQYIKVYEWILRHPELSRFEALLVCEIMRWPEGCYKSSQRLADLLRTDKRYINRTIKSLRKRGWVTILPDTSNKQLRILYATPKEPPLGPLFEYIQKAESARAEKRKEEAKALVKKMADDMFAG